MRGVPRAIGIAAGALLLAGGACARRQTPVSLAISVPWEIDTLDPHARDRLGSSAVCANLYEPLVALDAEMGIRPALAERWDTPDLLTWVFHLRRGVRFHGGRELTAADVVGTFDRLRADPALACGIYLAQIDTYRALDERTVEVRTRRPLGVLLNKLAKVYVVPGDAGAAIASRPDGTGPYRLAGFVPGRVELERNESYWGPRPDVARATLLLERSDGQAAADFDAGRADLVQCPSRELLAGLAARDDVTVSRRPELFVKYLSFDVARETTPFVPGRPNPFLSRAVREAISLGLDRKALVAGLPTHAVPARQLVPPSIFGYDPSLPEPVHDPSRALRLLQEAGFPNGFDVTLHTRTRWAEVGRLIARLLAPIGVRVTVAELPEAEFFESAAKGGLSFYFASFGCASGDASDLLDAAFRTPDAARRLGTSNYGGFSDPALEAAIERSAEILESVDRRSALWAIFRKISSEHVWIPLYVDENAYAVRKPFQFHPRANSYVLAADVFLPRR